MSEIRKWLVGIGLDQYADAFQANDIDMDLLKQVDDQTLKDIGIASAGHRLRIRSSIAKMGSVAKPEVNATAALAAPGATAASAERRQLTVVFCDLVGSAALSARLDPEDLRGIIGAYHRCCTELVDRNGGFVAKYIGDGVLAYFGYPKAHEHDAERAVRAALNLVEAVPKLATNDGLPLQVRIGIATGLVVVGDCRSRCSPSTLRAASPSSDKGFRPWTSLMLTSVAGQKPGRHNSWGYPKSFAFRQANDTNDALASAVVLGSLSGRGRSSSAAIGP